MKGHIEITDKVYFVYYELEKPDSVIYEQTEEYYFDCKYYQGVVKAYEASKKTVEVSNVFYWNVSKTWTFASRFKRDYDNEKVKNNQKCEANVTDTALITKLL